MPAAVSFARAPAARFPVSRPSTTSSRRASASSSAWTPGITRTPPRPASSSSARQLDVALEHRAHARVDMRILMSLEAHQLADDLRVGLAVEAVVRRARRAEDLA